MIEIIKGTTPTIKYTYTNINPSTFTVALLTVKRNNTVLVERDLTTATIDGMTIAWTLTQAETLSVDGKAEIMCNFVSAGIRGASKRTAVEFTTNHKEKVL